MKLAKRDVPNRIETSLNKSIRVGGGVVKFGARDDYPNVIENVVSSSVTAVSTSDIYSRFLTGQGFKEEGLNDIVISHDVMGKEIRMLDLLRLFSGSVAKFNGIWVHLPMNVEGKIKEPDMINFKHCRFTKIDEIGFTPTMAFNKNFGTKDFKKDKTVEFDIFNNKPEVLKSQMLKAGGPSAYKGQVYYQFWDNRYIYPLSPYDPVYLDCDSEWQVSLFKNRELRNGFMLRYLLRVAEFESATDKADFLDAIMGGEGADGDRIAVLEDEFDAVSGQIKSSGSFQLDKIESNVEDKLFENWESSLMNKIRKANKALPQILIEYENSQLGSTSGEAIGQAVSFYNGMTKDDRTLMSRVFSEIMSNHADENIAKITNWEIEPFSLEEKVEEVIEASADQKNADAQAALRGSVGGFNAVLALQKGIVEETVTKEAAIAALEILMGVSQVEAIRLIGNPKPTEEPKTE